MSENDKNERSNSSNWKVVFSMIILIVFAILIVCYYPIVKNNLLNHMVTLPQIKEEEDGSTLKGQVDIFVDGDLKDKEVTVFNYLNNEVYKSDNNNSIEIREANKGYVFRDENDNLQAAFLGDSWYALEILPTNPIESVFINEEGEIEIIEGETLNVEQ